MKHAQISETTATSTVTSTMSDKPFPNTIDNKTEETAVNDDFDDIQYHFFSDQISIERISYPATGGVKGRPRRRKSLTKIEMEGRLDDCIANRCQNEALLTEKRNIDESSYSKFEVFQNPKIGKTISQFLNTQSIRNVKNASFFFPFIDYWRISGSFNFLYL